MYQPKCKAKPWSKCKDVNQKCHTWSHCFSWPSCNCIHDQVPSSVRIPVNLVSLLLICSFCCSPCIFMLWWDRAEKKKKAEIEEKRKARIKERTKNIKPVVRRKDLEEEEAKEKR